MTDSVEHLSCPQLLVGIKLSASFVDMSGGCCKVTNQNKNLTLYIEEPCYAMVNCTAFHVKVLKTEEVMY